MLFNSKLQIDLPIDKRAIISGVRFNVPETHQSPAPARAQEPLESELDSRTTAIKVAVT